MLEHTSNKIPNVLDLFSPEPHPDDLARTLELRECKTREEKIACLEKHGFSMADQNKVSSMYPQNT